MKKAIGNRQWAIAEEESASCFSFPNLSSPLPVAHCLLPSYSPSGLAFWHPRWFNSVSWPSMFDDRMLVVRQILGEGVLISPADDLSKTKGPLSGPESIT